MQETQSQPLKARLVTAQDVSVAKAASDKAMAYLDEAESLLSSIVSRQEQLPKLLKGHERLRTIRRQFDAWTTRVGGLVLGIVISCGFILVVFHVLGLPPALSAISILATLVVLVFQGKSLFEPGDSQIDSQITTWQQELRTLDTQKLETETIISIAKPAYDEAFLNHQLVLQAFQSRLNRLRSTDWRVLQSIPFENFLAEVFTEWGYDVETTKTSGDQGVDLVVSKNGIRMAIQAKGYLSSTVGNDAIQQVYTGMKIYKCQQCAVITNSTFTSSARQAAAAVGCVLIDGALIPLLIEGKVLV